ncbi:MAG: hypothetical protein HUU55_00950 [Myxococcales bacterium]|nr:hypothetical protein [Myxococcales bacterium]
MLSPSPQIHNTNNDFNSARNVLSEPYLLLAPLNNDIGPYGKEQYTDIAGPLFAAELQSGSA